MGCYWDEDGVEEAEGVLWGMLVSTGCLDGCGVCRIGVEVYQTGVDGLERYVCGCKAVLRWMESYFMIVQECVIQICLVFSRDEEKKLIY